MRRLILLLMLIGSAISIPAQTHDEKFADAMNRNDWFILDSLHLATPKDSVMPFLEVFSRCLIGNRFNRPEISIPAFEELFNTHSSSLGLENLLSSTIMYATDMSRIGYNKEVSEFINNVLTSTRQYLDSTWTISLEQGISRYRALSEYKPYNIAFSEEIGRIPFKIVPVGEEKHGSVLMHLEKSSVNGHDADITFDTGAGVNMICDSLATAYNLIPIDGYITVAGVGRRNGQVAIARELKIGNITVRDVPFVIVNFETGNAKADRFIGSFNLVVGSELMLRLKDLTIDFITREITVPSEASVRDDVSPNMCFGDGMGLNVKGSVLGNPLVMNIDTGDSSYGSLGVAFFNANKEYIVCEAQPDTIRRGGLGGVAESLCYRLPEIPVSMGGYTIDVPGIVVYTQEMQTAMDFNCNIGLKILMMFDKIRFNLVDFILTTYPQRQAVFSNPNYKIPSFKFTKDKGISLLQALGITAVGVTRSLINPNAPANPDL